MADKRGSMTRRPARNRATAQTLTGVDKSTATAKKINGGRASTSTQRIGGLSPLEKLPGEIRNLIYHYVLEEKWSGVPILNRIFHCHWQLVSRNRKDEPALTLTEELRTPLGKWPRHPLALTSTLIYRELGIFAWSYTEFTFKSDLVLPSNPDRRRAFLANVRYLALDLTYTYAELRSNNSNEKKPFAQLLEGVGPQLHQLRLTDRTYPYICEASIGWWMRICAKSPEIKIIKLCPELSAGIFDDTYGLLECAKELYNSARIQKHNWGVEGILEWPLVFTTERVACIRVLRDRTTGVDA